MLYTIVSCSEKSNNEVQELSETLMTSVRSPAPAPAWAGGSRLLVSVTWSWDRFCLFLHLNGAQYVKNLFLL